MNKEAEVSIAKPKKKAQKWVYDYDGGCPVCGLECGDKRITMEKTCDETVADIQYSCGKCNSSWRVLFEPTYIHINPSEIGLELHRIKLKKG